MAIVVPVITTYDGSGIDRAIRDISGAETALGRVKAVGKGMQSVGKSLTYGVTLPIAAIGAASVLAARDFDSTMNQIAAISGETGAALEKSMKAAREEIVKMGTETIYSSQDAADAFLALQKAGVSTADITGGALASSMYLAATEGMDLAYAAEVMARAMNVYKIPASESAKVTDILAAGAIASTASVTDLAYGLKYVASAAAALGQPIDETVTALAILNNTGLTSQTAGTSLNQMFTQLVAPTKQAAETMAELGFSAVDAQGNLKSMPDILKDLDKSMDGMTKAERQDALRKMFNIRGMRAANNLLEAGAEGWEAMADQINTTGGAAKLADARMQGIAGALEYARGSIETASIALGEALAPAIEKVAGWVDKLADWFTRLDPQWQTVIATALAFMAVIGPILLIVGMLISSITSIIGAMTAIAGAIGIATGAMLGWIAVIALVVAAVVAVAILIYKNWDAIKDFTIKIWNKIVSWFKDKIDEFKRSFPETFAAIIAFVKVFWNVVQSMFILYFGMIWAFVKASWEFGKGLFLGALKAIWAVVKFVWDLIWISISTTFNQIMVFIETTLQVIKAIFKGDWGAVLGIIKDGAVRILDLFKQFPGKILRALGDLGSLLFSAGKDVIRGLINGIKSMIGSLGSVIGTVLDKLNPFKKATASGGFTSPSAPTGYVGMATYGLAPAVPLAANSTTGPVTIYISGDENPYRTARVVKRAIEGYDLNQGRRPAEPLARAW
jgi:TP901 family phage tail tape measure protein